MKITIKRLVLVLALVFILSTGFQSVVYDESVPVEADDMINVVEEIVAVESIGGEPVPHPEVNESISVETQGTDIKDGDYKGEIQSDGRVVITEYKGSSADIVVPTKLKGYTVSKLGQAFKGNSNIKKVHLNIPVVGKQAFEDCDNLSSVTFGANVAKIEEQAFKKCIRLKSVSIPGNVKSVGKSAFEECKGLEAASIAYETKMRDSLFKKCVNLKEFIVPAGVTEIEENAFGECKELSRIEIPNSVTQISGNAFAECDRDILAIYAGSRSYAKRYAESNGIKFKSNDGTSGNVAVKSIRLNRSSYKLEKGLRMQLRAIISPSDASNKAVSWTSSDTKIATVDRNGKVTGIKNGSAQIIATTVDGAKKASCKVTVLTPATGVTLNESSVAMKKGRTVQLTVTSYNPTSVYPKKITWKSNDYTVATVDSNGEVTAKHSGTAYIYAKTWNGVFDKCKIVVR